MKNRLIPRSKIKAKKNGLKIIVAGSRHFLNYDAMEKVLDNMFRTFPVAEVVSGGANGADNLGELYARRHLIPIKKFTANWNAHGRSAGPIRNREMAQYADGLIAFLAPNSKGTADMIKAANDAKLNPIVVVDIGTISI